MLRISDVLFEPSNVGILDQSVERQLITLPQLTCFLSNYSLKHYNIYFKPLLPSIWSVRESTNDSASQLEKGQMPLFTVTALITLPLWKHWCRGTLGYREWEAERRQDSFSNFLSAPHRLPASASRPAESLERLTGEITGQGCQLWQTDTRVSPNVPYEINTGGRREGKTHGYRFGSDVYGGTEGRRGLGLVVHLLSYLQEPHTLANFRAHVKFS